MAKVKEQKKSNAENTAIAQRVGYITADHWVEFEARLITLKIKYTKQFLGDVILVRVANTKFYTESK